MASPLETTSSAPAPSDEELESVGLGAVVLLVALVPLALGTVVWTSPGSSTDPNRWVSVSPSDVASLAILTLWAASTLGRGRRTPLGRLGRPLGWAVAIALGLEAVALAVHPSPRGFELLARVAAAAATADLVRRARGAGRRRALLAGIVAVGSAQALLAIVQSLTGKALAVRPFAFDGELYQFGSSWAGRGGFGHPYHLSCLLALAIGAAILGVHGARRPLPWCLALGLCATGMAVTFSRAGVLGLAAVLVVAAVSGLRNRDRSGWIVLAITVGLAVGMTGFGDGWASKSADSVDGSSVDSGRRDRAAEAVRLVRSEPLVGVGPGRYVIALEDVDHTELRPAHDLPLHVSAEAGLFAGVAAAVALALLALHCLRLGARCLTVFLPMVPFLLLDAYPYTWPGGLALSGVWLGLLGSVWYRDPTERVAAEPVTAPRAPVG